LPPKVKSILLLAVERKEREKGGKAKGNGLTYYNTSILVIQIGV
jgi:hypothetical protein